VVGEELGLIGALCVAAAFVVLLWRGFQIAARCEDFFSALLAAGVTFLVTAQGFLNMAVATGLLPTTGIPLPLISMGGSSLVFTLISLGVLISIESSQHAAMQSGPGSPLDAANGWISRTRKPILRRRALS
ncbi:MAG: FtsW/RodA/SpoVE family cell cycle protein, partial [Nitrospinae bacterium]|nr:FtsW/RodA/SpoVE family cell cycle protein [Nitrospinota bacterium]